MTTTTTERAASIELAQLTPNPRNIRRDLGDLTELRASIEAVGVLQPLVVTPAPGGDGYVIIAGHRRHAAAQLACLTEVPCQIRPDLVGDVDQLTAMLGENLHRSDLTAIEEAAAYTQLDILGLKVPEMASRTGVAQKTIRSRMKLLDLPEKTRDRIQAGQYTLDQAAALSEFAGNARAVRDIEAAHAANGDGGFHYAVIKARQAKAAKAALEKTVRALRKQAVIVHTDDSAPAYGRRVRTLLGMDWSTADVDQEAIDAHAATGCAHALEAWISVHGTVTLCCVSGDHAIPGQGEDVPDDEDGDSELGAPERTPATDLGPDRSHADVVAEQTARQDAQRAAQADCDAAATVRRQHIDSYLRREQELTSEMRDAILRYIATTMVGTCEIFGYKANKDIAAALGVTTDDTGADQALFDRLDTVKDPLLALLAVLALDREDTLQRVWAWDPGRLNRPAAPGEYVLSSRAWLDLLAGPLGYEFTPWESDRLDAADAPEESQNGTA